MAVILADPAIIDKFEINAIPVAAQVILRNVQLVTIPGMDGVSGTGFGSGLTGNPVINDFAFSRMFEIYPEKAVFNHIIPDDEIMRFNHPDGTSFFQVTGLYASEDQPDYADLLAGDQE